MLSHSSKRNTITNNDNHDTNTKMGTAPPSKPTVVTRPFDKQRSASASSLLLLRRRRRRRSHNKPSSILLQLIAARDWQKVLIRCSLFPSEMVTAQTLDWYGVEWQLLPLHLACALQPPPQVVSKLLQLHPETAQVYMIKTSLLKPIKKKKKKNKKSKRRFSLPQRRNKKSHFGGLLVHNNATHDLSWDDSQQQQQHHHSSSSLRHASPGDDDYDDYPEQALLHDTHSTKTPSGVFSLERSVGDGNPNDSPHNTKATANRMHPSPVISSPEKEPCGMWDDGQEDDEEDGDHDARDAVALQWSPMGGVAPLEQETTEAATAVSPDSTNNTTSTPLPTMQWNLEPLLHEAQELLPLHIASLYRASAQVLRLLLQAHPLGAQVVSSLGMLPLHMATARFALPPPVAEAPRNLAQDLIPQEYCFKEALRVLAEAHPRGLAVASENNGMTPQEYLEEVMEDGAEKEDCVALLQSLRPNKESRNSTTVTSTIPRDEEVSVEASHSLVPSEILCDESTLPSFHSDTDVSHHDVLGQLMARHGKTPLYTLMTAREWKLAFHVVEEDPLQACEWQYGIEMEQDSEDPQLWKRLPIHSACCSHAPVGLVEALFQANPKGVLSEDPYTGELPLHLACRFQAPSKLVDAILSAYPRAAKHVDRRGRLPLHAACLAGASLCTVQQLIKVHPHSVSALDDKKQSPLAYAAAETSKMDGGTIRFLNKIHDLLETDKNLTATSLLSAIVEDEEESGDPSSVCESSSAATSCDENNENAM